MRVLTVVGALGAGGTERAAQNYALGYKASGLESAVLAFGGGGARATVLENAAVSVFIGGESVAKKDKAIQKALSWQYDVVHIHRPGLYNPVDSYVLSALRGRAKAVLETNVFSRVDYTKDRQLIDVHLHLSKWCLWKWRQWARGLKPEPMGVVVPYMVRANDFFPAEASQTTEFRLKYNIPQRASLLGRVGQPISSKWSSSIFDVFRTVLDRKPNTYLLLVGMPQYMRGLYNALPNEVQEKIRIISFLNSDEELRTCYSAIDVFLHIADIGESFGMVLAEAMLCECPIVTLSTPLKDNSQVEVVGHLKGGIVASKLDDLVEGVCMLLEQPQLMDSLRIQGREEILRRYETNVVMEQLLRVLHYVVSSDGRSELLTKLTQDPLLVTNVTTHDVMHMLKSVLGKMEFRTHFAMLLVHDPVLYRIWSSLR